MDESAMVEPSTLYKPGHESSVVGPDVLYGTSMVEPNVFYDPSMVKFSLVESSMMYDVRLSSFVIRKVE